MKPRFDHLLRGPISTELVPLNIPTPAIIKDNNCPIYAYVNSLRSRASQETVRRVLQSIAKKLNQRNLYSIVWKRFDRNTLNSLVNLLHEEGLSNETISLYLSVTKSVLKEAYLLGQIDTLHWERAKAVAKPASGKKREHATLSELEFDTLLQEISQNAASPAKEIRDKAIFHLLIGCGLRRFELINLKVDNINFMTNTLTFDGKGRKERDVTIHPYTMTALKQWLDMRSYKPGYVFTRVYKGGRVHDSVRPEISGEVKKMNPNSVYLLCEKYGLLQRGIAPHSLRRSYATLLSTNGANIQYIAKLMGHSSIKTTEVYIKSDKEEIEKAVLTQLFTTFKS
ncbi:tyrosine-type recombinase/integrase [Pseudoalteromonas sp. NGC95]|uniref:tyrosine-type recombinase/integrase n=1 Tax=Pseudoalteromonas sp. NGC95 TaxID=2792051 RepID=UPI0018CD5C89|nr:site-specific integrase [Pseudoalteromonas sp. NGC95]MBH0017889.1 tyrosine-type recombinase/integrase [Pseudoalteromonas sp. NGC95]